MLALPLHGTTSPAREDNVIPITTSRVNAHWQNFVIAKFILIIVVASMAALDLNVT
jgi:hypothetical protein